MNLECQKATDKTVNLVEKTNHIAKSGDQGFLKTLGSEPLSDLWTVKAFLRTKSM